MLTPNDIQNILLSLKKVVAKLDILYETLFVKK